MQGGEGTFFVSRNLAKKPYGSWAFSLIECVAVWALKLPVPHTDVTKLRESKEIGSDPLSQTSQLLLDFGSELI